MWKYFALGNTWLMICMLVVMGGWMFIYAYQYIFLNSQGDLPPDQFSNKKFALYYGLILLSETLLIFFRGVITFVFALGVRAGCVH